MQPPKGTRDFLPEQMRRRQQVVDTARKVFERFGFEPMDTPAIESWELLSRKGGGGEDIKKEIYYFKDKGDREIGLRFDLTAPMARVIASNPQLPKPFKRYQIGPVWRYDNPQAGRYREFWQADADIIGSEKMDCEAECLAVAVTIIEALGFRDFAIRLNNRKVLNGIMEMFDIPKETREEVFRSLDKIEKIGTRSVTNELRKAGLNETKIRKLMEIVKERGSPSTVLKTESRKFGNYSLVSEGISELEQIVEKCRSYGIERKIIIDLSLVRGLDYYTGPIFEISVRTKKEIGSIAGGGRYDNLVETYGGRWTPAVGISLGVERICEIMDSEGMMVPETRTNVFVAIADERFRDKAVEIAQSLRAGGINTNIDLTGRPLKKQLDYADSLKIPYVIFVGEREIKSGKFVLRDMNKRKQGEFTLEKIIKMLGK
ncbi:MAG: histidine--tRNA ligase [Candidatus Aenigmatarchaeota archaeon]